MTVQPAVIGCSTDSVFLEGFINRGASDDQLDELFHPGSQCPPPLRLQPKSQDSFRTLVDSEMLQMRNRHRVFSPGARKALDFLFFRHVVPSSESYLSGRTSRAGTLRLIAVEFPL